MGIGRRLVGLVLQRGKHNTAKPRSIVLLLREATFFHAGEVRRAGEMGFGIPFDNEANPMCGVVQEHEITVVKAGPYVVHVLHGITPYLGDVDRAAKRLSPKQRTAWRRHTAWVAIDLFNEDIPEAESYAVLARLALGLGDERCVGMYVPKRKVVVPNDGSMEVSLRQMVRGAEITMA